MIDEIKHRKKDKEIEITMKESRDQRKRQTDK